MSFKGVKILLMHAICHILGSYPKEFLSLGKAYGRIEEEAKKIMRLVKKHDDELSNLKRLMGSVVKGMKGLTDRPLRPPPETQRRSRSVLFHDLWSSYFYRYSSRAFA